MPSDNVRAVLDTGLAEGIKHETNCPFEDTPVKEAPCLCYEAAWVRLGRNSMKHYAAKVVEQCKVVDSTIAKLADAIRELD